MERFATRQQAETYFAEHNDIAKSFTAKIDEDEKGSLRAVFSTFDVLDSHGDVVLASAFTEGQEVAMVWSHDWDRVIGKGVIRKQEDRAIWDGKFFLDTEAGLEAYKTVKNMGDLQEYSWGFRITEYDIEEDEDAPWGYKRIIKGAEVYEVSPVLIGANRQTRTLSVKALEPSMKDLIEGVVKNYLDEHFSATNTDEHNVVILRSLGDLTTWFKESEDDIEVEIEEEILLEVEEPSEEDAEKQARTVMAKYLVDTYHAMEALS